jgi:hypothetical protein
MLGLQKNRKHQRIAIRQQRENWANGSADVGPIGPERSGRVKEDDEQ